MSELFFNLTSFNEDIGDWEVTDTSKMFSNDESFNTYIGKWDVRKVVSKGNPPESNLFIPERYVTEEITIPKQIPKIF